MKKEILDRIANEELTEERKMALMVQFQQLTVVQNKLNNGLGRFVIG